MKARLLRPLPLLACAALAFAGCEQADPLDGAPAIQLSKSVQANRSFAALRRATARYHNLKAATDDGFILLHDCEVRPGEGAVGILYINLENYLDGVIDPARPDGLLYAPGRQGKPRLAGVELAVPIAMWSEAAPPEFLGVPFQTEDEFAAYGLHIWTWRHNPNGMFAQAHPRISCEAES
jgi:hypothetical protein